MNRWLNVRIRREQRRELLLAAVLDAVWLVVVATLCFAIVAQAHSATVLDASVIVRCPARTVGEVDCGSGTVIDTRDGYSLVLTCGHVVRDAATSQVTVQFRDGRVAPGTILRWSDAPDLAAISVPVAARAYTPIARQAPVIRQPVTLIGRLLVRAGAVLTVNTYRANVTLGIPAVSGDSGGGVFLQTGELVGVCWGSADGEAFVVPLADIQKFVGEVQVRQTGCRWVRDNCGNWVKICDQQPASFVPPSQQQQPPPAVQQPAATNQPAPTTGANCNCTQNFAAINVRLTQITAELTALRAQLAATKPCECGDVDTKIAAAVSTIKVPAPNVDELAAAVAARQQPFYMRVDPRADYQPIKPGQYVTLPLDKLTH